MGVTILEWGRDETNNIIRILADETKNTYRPLGRLEFKYRHAYFSDKTQQESTQNYHVTGFQLKFANLWAT